MEHVIVEKTVIERYVKNEFGEFEINNLYETLTEGLEGTGMGNPVVLYNSGMKKWFESLGVIFVNTRGSCYIHDEEKYNKLVDSLREIVYAEET
ncbi:hypothetical protein D3C81_610040 [compost metagenome]